LQQERDRDSNQLASINEENVSLKNRPSEVLKLRGEVGTLRDQKAQLGGTAAISKLTATPEVRQLMHDQQKAGMAAIYKGLATQMKLNPDQTEKLNNLLADHVMQDIDYITTALHDKTPVDQANQAFANDTALIAQEIQDLFGADAASQYKDYNKNLLSSLTSQQFEDQLTGSDSEKKDKVEKLRLAIQQEAQSAVANAGLPSDFQTVPILNLVNILSEQQADQNVKLLQSIYQSVAGSAGAYLSPDEITKFQTFTGKAVNNNVAALKANRSLMAPISSQ